VIKGKVAIDRLEYINNLLEVRRKVAHNLFHRHRFSSLTKSDSKVAYLHHESEAAPDKRRYLRIRGYEGVHGGKIALKSFTTVEKRSA
jgi:hypothetical protein